MRCVGEPGAHGLDDASDKGGQISLENRANLSLLAAARWGRVRPWARPLVGQYLAKTMVSRFVRLHICGDMPIHGHFCTARKLACASDLGTASPDGLSVSFSARLPCGVGHQMSPVCRDQGRKQTLLSVSSD
jgi:hypothetical protein